jgi:hypothetical protein
LSDEEPLAILIHAEPKVGKTTAGVSTPAPRLILDAENMARFAAKRQGKAAIYWDPLTDAPPEADGTWDTCIVLTRNWKTFSRTFDWLNSCEHPFVSVVIDTIDEIQDFCLKDITDGKQARIQDWGTLLENMATKIREFRDLFAQPENPVKVLVGLTHTAEKSGRFRPHVKGALQIKLPGMFNTVGYLFAAVDEDGEKVRRLLVSPHENFDAGDSTGTFPDVITNPNIEDMFIQMNKTLNGEETQ